MRLKCNLIKALSISSLSVIVYSANSFAARPMMTDDADILAKGLCQVEAWLENHSQAQNYWLIPSCNVGGTFELALGMSRHDDQTAKHSQHAIIMQAKTLFKHMDNHGFGLGMVVGSEQPTHKDNKADYWLNIPFSWMPNPTQAYTLHLNAGLHYDGENQQTNSTWAIGVDYELSQQVLVFAETLYSQQAQLAHIGLAYSLIPQRFQLDLSGGDYITERQNSAWVTFGFTYFWQN